MPSGACPEDLSLASSLDPSHSLLLAALDQAPRGQLHPAGPSRYQPRVARVFPAKAPLRHARRCLRGFDFPRLGPRNAIIRAQNAQKPPLRAQNALFLGLKRPKNKPWGLKHPAFGPALTGFSYSPVRLPYSSSFLTGISHYSAKFHCFQAVLTENAVISVKR